MILNTPDRHNPQSPGARRQAWSSYWAHGALHSLEGSFEGGYGGSIRRFWEGVFEALEAGDRVLDVGTGNERLRRRARGQDLVLRFPVERRKRRALAPATHSPVEHELDERNVGSPNVSSSRACRRLF